MALSKDGFSYKKTPGHENDCDVSWCKYVCGFLKPGITHQDYSSWRNGIKQKMGQDRILGWRQSTNTQWAAIEAHSRTLGPFATPAGSRAGLRQTETVRRRPFTECLNCLPKDLAKKHRKRRESVKRALGAPILAAAFPAGNVRKLT